MPAGIIHQSGETMLITDGSYFEMPLKISPKVTDYSALGLEQNYADKEFKLVNAYIPSAGIKREQLKINPSLEEIIANDAGLLVKDENGVIRVVYATTNHFDFVPGDNVIILGFRSISKLQPVELDLNLNGKGGIGKKYGDEAEDAYLVILRLLVQITVSDKGFDLSGYPNPIADQVTIDYSLPESGLLKLKVYDAIGHQLAEIVNETRGEGQYSAVFAPGSLPDGIYIFKLDFISNKQIKFLFLKLVH